MCKVAHQHQVCDIQFENDHTRIQLISTTDVHREGQDV